MARRQTGQQRHWVLRTPPSQVATAAAAGEAIDRVSAGATHVFSLRTPLSCPTIRAPNHICTVQLIFEHGDDLRSPAADWVRG